MVSVRVRELKTHTSEVLRRVRDGGETIDITQRGKVIARVVPVEPTRPDPEEVAEWWREME